MYGGPFRLAAVVEDGGLDERHAPQTGLDAGYAWGVRAFGMAANGLGEIAIEVGHGFQVTLGMPGRQTHATLSRLAQPRLADTAAQDAQGLVEGAMDQARRFFLAPPKAPLSP